MYLITSVQLVNRKSNVYLNRLSLRYALLSSVTVTVAIRVSKAIAVLWFLGLCCVSTFSLPFLELGATSDALLIFGLPPPALPFLFPFPSPFPFHFPSSTFFPFCRSHSISPHPPPPNKKFLIPNFTRTHLFLPSPFPSPYPLVPPPSHTPSMLPSPTLSPLTSRYIFCFRFFAFGQGCRSWVDSTVFTIIIAV